MSNGDSHDYGMPVHPVCDMFPLMTRLELEALADDITAHGLMNPVVVHHSQLVDGRNRLIACREAGVTPATVEWRDIYKGDEPLSRWIWSMNAERRHLTEDQYIQAQVAICAYEETEAAKLRMSVGGKAAGNHRPKGVTERSQPKKREPAVRTKIAKQLGVSERKVQQAMTVQKKTPELAKEVIQGKIPLHEAAKRVATPSTKPSKPSKPSHVLRVDRCDQCSRVAVMLKELRHGITRRRNESDIKRAASIWHPDDVSKADLIGIVEYVEQQLDLIAAVEPASRATSVGRVGFICTTVPPNPTTGDP
jgi:hypothetical protein